MNNPYICFIKEYDHSLKINFIKNYNKISQIIYFSSNYNSIEKI